MKVNEYIEAFNKKSLIPITGLTAEQTLESLILKELSDIRDHAGQACIEELKTTGEKRNTPMTMAKSGAKGSYINVSQMAVCVGQQSIRGQRVTEGFANRVLPHFLPGERGPKAKGFVENSFWSGLDPYEFFFHAMAGREGLLDTAVKTAETGYMQRRLIKGLEDLVVHYDYSVRNSNGEMIQFDYGDDYIDPINIESSEMLIDFDYYWKHILATSKIEYDKLVKLARYKGKYSIVRHQKEELSSWIFVHLFSFNDESYKPITFDQWNKPFDSGEVMRSLVEKTLDSITAISQFYKNEIRKFLFNIAQQLDKTRNKYNQQMASRTAVVNNEWQHICYGITKGNVLAFLRRLEHKFTISKIEPGTAIGAICAQSIGEPTTQMTLKTFHFTGVASMNITQGTEENWFSFSFTSFYLFI